MIPKNIFCFGCFFLLVLLCFCFDNSVGEDRLLAPSCQKSTRYNPDSPSGRTFTDNLNELLSNLGSNGNQQTGFYNYTAGVGNGGSQVHGLFLCRGDIDTSSCQKCVKRASDHASGLCEYVKTATFWYDECTLRFSNESIFSRRETIPELSLCNDDNVTETALLNQVLGDTMDQIATKAASGGGGSGKKFAVQEANFTEFQKRIYALGQCTPDLSAVDCEICLRAAIKELPTRCNSSQGGRILYPSCNIRYETYPFYTIPTPGPNLVLPVAVPPTASSKHNGRSQRLTVLAIVVPILLTMLLLIMMVVHARRLRQAYDFIAGTVGVSKITTTEKCLQCYSFTEIQACTNNFADDNMIGKGGFGSVYEGTLPNGQHIAVKRLCKTSAQGAKELINEISLVAKLHHRNLVQLLGYCLEKKENILIYEFVHNKSLDHFLFDAQKQPLLNWSKRYNIIGGIVRGLVYLHEDSRHKIIHRDLKASNVLLDESMNAKIADFGLARLFEVDQSEAKTSKVAGTFGYMSPEYGLHGLFSAKSDVYSFGVLVLEIISGKRNSKSDDVDDLLSYAWRQWRDGNPLALVDPNIGESCNRNEVTQCVHIGLLCVQEDVEQRPTMASIVLMLNCSSITLPIPNPPAFFNQSIILSFPNPPVVGESESKKPSSSAPEFSNNQEPITQVYPR